MANIFIKTFGCQSNYADSETIAGLLAEHGHILVNSVEEADFVITNSCGVKGKTENRITHFIREASLKRPTYVGGCLTSMVSVKKLCPDIAGVFDVNSILNIPSIIGKENVKAFSKIHEERVGLPRVRYNKEVAIINISQGCLNKCTFCGTKLARGTLFSYSPDKIVAEVKKAVLDGCTKIYLSSQDNGCYGYDIGTNLPYLLSEVVKIPGEFTIRVGMGNPQWIKKHIPELIKIFSNEKIKKFLHVPVQSGSERIVSLMKRGHTVEDFLMIVRSFREAFPGITIATDIIVGYPDEKEEDFQATVELIREVRPEVVNLSKFASRPKTYASTLTPLPSQEVKKRSRIISLLLNGSS